MNEDRKQHRRERWERKTNYRKRNKKKWVKKSEELVDAIPKSDSSTSEDLEENKQE
jgi:hypothetical protein